MAVFEYKAKDEEGNIFSGVYHDIDSLAALREELGTLGYSLVKARRKKAVRGDKRKIKQSEVVSFAHRFAGMCSAGLSIDRCLQVLEEQTENPPLRSRIADVRQHVETGSTLREAFGKYKDVFSDFFLGMIEAGESGGKLSHTLEMAAVYLEKQNDLRRQVKSAFAYPVVVGVMCLLIVIYLIIFVIPVFSKVYQQLHVNLPGPTQALLSLSVLFRECWMFLLVIAFGCVILGRKLSKNPRIRVRWDAFKLDMPVFGKLNKMLVLSRFIRTFAMLAAAGVSYIDSLEIAGVVASNHTVKDIGGKLQERLETGSTVTEAMSDHEIFPPMVIQLASAGEEAGVLPEMLNKGVDFLDKDISRNINVLLVKLEPTLTVIMGTVVGFILVGVYLPLFDYMAHLK
ncbi:MAG: type II secretion system F family protein [Planctomycetota bacterium]|nr:MAG: type II secretion system F family protein [Planctomycetota bacterium]